MGPLLDDGRWFERKRQTREVGSLLLSFDHITHMDSFNSCSLHSSDKIVNLQDSLRLELAIDSTPTVETSARLRLRAASARLLEWELDFDSKLSREEAVQRFCS